ncbi:MAG TPA: (d)CMP kinase [Candidatus Eisenbergiella pullistercoris]|uniref:Cytidylate kinase n=1 Tax=Candidatus Eisenbergiella pullistercoris TaxID=2838555 RepID=A0A9D1YNC0_9FIRM|nr:(d)CMP kinase [Candidatus Eisenbergiella pullistercoris]
MSINIAIDGPAGAGKSTVARRAAEKLGFVYVDTGAMYRAIALYLLRQGVSPEEKDRIAEKCAGADVSISYRNGEQIVSLNGENVNGLIRTDEVTKMSSAASAVPAVRERLLDLQRGLAAKNNVLMDGRDIGTCILPDAQVKIFLTASTAVRAKRRFDELCAKGDAAETLESVEAKIMKRDEDDRNREISPLREAPDAVHLDTSDMNIDQAVEAVLSICREKGCIG